MAPAVSFTKITLPYPVYAADFDPYKRGYLVVGGGGGEGRSGVPNQITLLDVSSRASIEVAAEVDLTRDEDAVMTLANLASKDGLITFAGINSSTKERVADQNKHLRSFKIDYPRKKKTEAKAEAKAEKGSVAFLGKTQLFKPPTTATAKNENYQRLLRLSPAQKRESGSKRIGAIATSLNPVAELVIFDATTAVPSDWDVIQRIYPKEGKEVNDVDICEASEGNFSVAYSTDNQVFVSRITYDFGKKKATSITSAESPVPAYTLPFPDVFAPGPRPTIKYLRFLTPHHILLCCNKAQRKGAELLILRKLPDTPGEVILQKKLPGRIKAAGSVDVCALNADPTTGAQQIVVAVAGHDISIELYTLEYSAKTDTLSKFNSYTTLRDVHPLQMTKLAFEPYHNPWQTASPKTPGPQYLRLASTSLGNTVVVDTFPLTPLSPKIPHSRYVLKGGSNVLRDRTLPVLAISVAVAVFMICLQQYLNLIAVRDGKEPFTFLTVPQSVQSYLGQVRGGQSFSPPGARDRAAVLSIPTATIASASEKATDAFADAAAAADDMVKQATTLHLRTLLQAYAPSYLRKHLAASSPSDNDEDDDPTEKAIVIRAGPTEDDAEAAQLSAEVHEGSRKEARKRDAHARTWDALSEAQRGVWRQRLVKAKAWAVEEGEGVLRGVLFSEYAGWVGRAAGGA